MQESNQVSYVANSKYTEVQIKKLKEFINEEKLKVGGTFQALPFIGVDKNGNPFEYINDALQDTSFNK